MANEFAKTMFTEAAKRLQERYGSREQYERKAQLGPIDDQLGPDEIEFIRERDSFYIASEGDNGWPYVQHRGGPKGFLKVLDSKTLAFADFRGNRQYITAGNVSVNDRVTLFLMDYPRRTRLKVLGHARSIDAESAPELVAELTPEGYPAKVERIFKIEVVAFDWNCPQHITPRYTVDEWMEEMELVAAESAAGGSKK